MWSKAFLLHLQWGISLFWLCIFWRYALALFLFLNLYPWFLLFLYSDDLCPCPCWLRSLPVWSPMVVTRPQWECNWQGHIRLSRTTDWAYGRLSLAGGRPASPRQNRAQIGAWVSCQKPYAASNAIEEIVDLSAPVKVFWGDLQKEEIWNFLVWLIFQVCLSVSSWDIFPVREPLWAWKLLNEKLIWRAKIMCMFF